MKLLSYITWLAGAAFSIYTIIDGKDKMGFDAIASGLVILMVAAATTFAWIVAGIYFFYTKQTSSGKYAFLAALLQFVIMIAAAAITGRIIK